MQGDAVIPNHTSNIDLLIQMPIPLVLIQAEFVGQCYHYPLCSSTVFSFASLQSCPTDSL